VRSFAVLVATLLAFGMVGGCGGDGDDETPAAGGQTGQTGEAVSVAEEIGGVEDLEQCFTEAGTKIANRRSDLPFAQADARNLNIENEAQGVTTFGFATIELKPSKVRAGDYRIFAAYRESKTPELTGPVTAIQEYTFVVYFPPPADKAAIAEAEDCMDGVVGDG
jgi:hypothetical protein